MKSKKNLLLYALAALTAGWGTVHVSTSKADRTSGFFAAYRSTYLHTPDALKRFYGLADFLLLPVVEPLNPFEPVWLEIQSGTKIQLDPYDLVARKILETGEWEPASVNTVLDKLSAGGTFIDVGAHIGYYSLRAAPKVGPSGHVISVEPNPETLPKLRRNIAANEITAKNTMVWPVACSDTESTLKLYAAPRGNTGESSLSKENATQEGDQVVEHTVRARPLDVMVKEAKLDRVDVMKIDVEGAEFQVLKGAAQTLDQFHPVLIVEVLQGQLKSMGTSVEELEQFLTAHGYQAKGRVDNTNVIYIASK